MPLTEDLSAFLDSTEFATAATYKSATVYVIFERQFLDQLNVQTSAPTALGKKSDFAAVVQGDAITIGSTSYTVATFEHDPMEFPDFTLLCLKA